MDRFISISNFSVVQLKFYIQWGKKIEINHIQSWNLSGNWKPCHCSPSHTIQRFIFQTAVRYKAKCRSNPSFHNFSGCNKLFQILYSICSSGQAVALHTLGPRRWWSSIPHVINSAPKQRITEIVQQSARKSHRTVKLCPTSFHFFGVTLQSTEFSLFCGTCAVKGTKASVSYITGW